jgi:hypothetical protein
VAFGRPPRNGVESTAVRLLALAIVLLFAASEAGYLNCYGTLSPVSIKPFRANAYVASWQQIFQSPPWVRVFYSSDDTNNEPLRLLENGRPLGPVHSFPADIADQGCKFAINSDPLRVGNRVQSRPP